MKTKFLAVGILLIMMISCTKTPQDMIVGNWQAPDGKGSMEFFPDGGVTTRLAKEVAPGVDSMGGNWSILEDGSLKVDFSLMGKSMALTGTINFPDKEKLEITDDKGVVEHFIRIASPSDSVSPKDPASISVVGVYGGKGCVYKKLDFKEGGKLYVSVAGMEFQGEYEVDGNKVLFSDGQGRGIVFTKEGNILHGGSAGVCIRQ